MKQATATRQTEGTSAVIARTNYIPVKDDYYSEFGNVICVCGRNRYFPTDACRGCGSREIGSYEVSYEDRPLLSKKLPIKTRFWYHSTRRADWDKDVKKSGATVHLGNLSAAHERAEHEYEGGDPEYTVYKVILNPFASISDVICPDLVNGWSETMDEFRKNTDADFVRYVNAAENVGTVSLIGNPEKFIIVEKTAHRI